MKKNFQNNKSQRSKYELISSRYNSGGSISLLRASVALARSSIRMCCSCFKRSKNDLRRGMLLEMDASRPRALPKKSKKKQNLKTLVLDLDETLVHSSYVGMKKPDICFKMKNDQETQDIYVRKRPFVTEFLSIVSKYFEVVVFTASISNYADPLLDKLEHRGFIDHRLFRRHCSLSEGAYVKDLDILGRDLKDVIIVDNSSICFKYHPENGMHIKSFLCNKRDKELIRLVPFLIFLSAVDDVRSVSSWFEKFKHNQYIEYSDMAGELRILDKTMYLREIIRFFEKTYFKKKLERHKRWVKERELYMGETDILGNGGNKAEVSIGVREAGETKKKRPYREAVRGGGRKSFEQFSFKKIDPSFELLFQEKFYLTSSEDSDLNDTARDMLNESLETTLNDETIILEDLPFNPLSFSTKASMDDSFDEREEILKSL